MILKKLNSERKVNVNLSKYLIDWDGKCRSKFQFEVKQWLKPFCKAHITLEEFTIPGSRLKCDLVDLNLKMIVETSGDQHREYNSHFHQGSKTKYLGQIKRDADKYNWAEANGFKLVEIFKEDLPLTKEFFEKQDIYL
jgi:hypothetical protein